jgi:hypothetical protein
MISHASKDYDIPIHDVRHIYKVHGKDNFYDELENYIKDRKNKCEFERKICR